MISTAHYFNLYVVYKKEKRIESDKYLHQSTEREF